MLAGLSPIKPDKWALGTFANPLLAADRGRNRGIRIKEGSTAKGAGIDYEFLAVEQSVHYNS
jgi:hypothetical protein